MSDILYGRNTVEAAIENKRVKKIYILENHDLLNLVEENSIPYACPCGNPCRL